MRSTIRRGIASLPLITGCEPLAADAGCPAPIWNAGGPYSAIDRRLRLEFGGRRRGSWARHGCRVDKGYEEPFGWNRSVPGQRHRCLDPRRGGPIVSSRRAARKLRPGASGSPGRSDVDTASWIDPNERVVFGALGGDRAAYD